FDESWRMSLTLWAALIGVPGSKKTPTAQQGMRFIQRKEKAWRKEYEEALNRHGDEASMADIQTRRQNSRINQIIRDGLSDDAIPPAVVRPLAPAQRRLLVGNITGPKLQDLGAEPQNGRGLLRFDDEAIRYFARLDS